MPRFSRLMHTVCVLAVACASVHSASAEQTPAAPPAATATPREGSAPAEDARSLFAEGRASAARGDYPLACTQFERSLSLSPGIGVRFNVADCWQHIGRSASAYEQFLLTADAARAAGQAERERVARERAAELEPKLSRLRVEVDAAPAELALTRDGAPLEPASWGIALAVDPGTHTLGAVAPGYQAWSRDVEVGADAGVVVLHVPELTPSARVAVREPPAALTAPGTRAATSAAQGERATLRTPTILTLTVATIGVSGLVAGTVFGLQYQANNERAAGICSSGVGCSSQQITAHESLVADARQARNLALVSFGVGVLSLFGATAMYMRAPVAPASADWVAEPVLSADGSWGARARGRF